MAPESNWSTIYEYGERARYHESQPILSWFTVTAVPEGEAPETVREQWVGVTLPVRERSPAPDKKGVGVLTGTAIAMESAVAVKPDDAVIALRGAGKEEAASWWGEYWVDAWDGNPPVILFETNWGEQRAA